MYNILKVLLKTVGYAPASESVKTRVVFYRKTESDDNVYIAQYKKYGIWWNFTEFFRFGSKPSGFPSGFWIKKSKKYDQRFNQLVEFCKRFNTIDEYHRQEKINYKKACDEYIERTGTERKWESD